MKIALNSYSGYGAWFILKLISEGHSVDYFLSEPKYLGVLYGLIPEAKLLDLDHRRSPDNYRTGLPSYDKYDLSVFDLTGRKRQADHSIQNCPTIGDGTFQCFLEDDRLGGLKLMEEAGISVPPYQSFTDVGEAKAFVKKTGKRYVFKPDGGQDQAAESTYVSKDAEDLLEYFDKLEQISKGASFILQEFIRGTEVSVEGWFNGEDFYCLNSTLEEKKFMNDNVGPNTGCSGNLVFTISPDAKIYKQGLAKVKPILQQYGFRGMIDLNTIVTEDNIYGLEWTPRFGYDASATFINMYAGGFGELLKRTARGEVPEQSWKAEFGVSVRLSIPPYPTEMRMPQHKGIPIKGIDPSDMQTLLKTYLYDAYFIKNHLEVAGYSGLVACPIEVGSSIIEAFGKLEDTVKRIQIPDMQYRTDIQKSVTKRYTELDRMGLL